MENQNALAAAADDDVRILLTEYLAEAGFTDISASDGTELADLTKSKPFDVIVLSLPFRESFGLDITARLAKDSSAELVVLVPKKSYDRVCEKAVKYGGIILPRNAPRNIIVNMIKTCSVRKSRTDALRAENDDLRGTVDDIRLINRAKFVLIEYLRISENEAHAQLRKHAMDKRIPLAQAAADVLKTYEYKKFTSD